MELLFEPALLEFDYIDGHRYLIEAEKLFYRGSEWAIYGRVITVDDEMQDSRHDTFLQVFLRNVESPVGP